MLKVLKLSENNNFVMNERERLKSKVRSCLIHSLYLQSFSVQVHQLGFFSVYGNEKMKAIFLVCHLSIENQQEVLFHSILSLGNSVMKGIWCLFFSMSTWRWQASLIHVLLPKMSHVNTFNFKCNEGALAGQVICEILVREHTSSIEYENVEKYGRISISDMWSMKNVLKDGKHRIESQYLKDSLKSWPVWLSG